MSTLDPIACVLDQLHVDAKETINQKVTFSDKEAIFCGRYLMKQGFFGPLTIHHLYFASSLTPGQHDLGIFVFNVI